jgi:serine/threonine-protein kinase
VFDAVIPAGQVVGTDPAVGEVVAPNTPVDLLVSKGPEPIQVADLTNRRVAAATGSLEERGLIVNVIERFSEKIEQGRVIGQSPAPGTTIPSGSTVELLVSKGPPPVVVPNLIDMRRKAAVAALEDLGLRVTVEAGEFTPLNRVISQIPAAGTEVPKGSTVTIRII